MFIGDSIPCDLHMRVDHLVVLLNIIFYNLVNQKVVCEVCSAAFHKHSFQTNFKCSCEICIHSLYLNRKILPIEQLITHEPYPKY